MMVGFILGLVVGLFVGAGIAIIGFFVFAHDDIIQ